MATRQRLLIVWLLTAALPEGALGQAVTHPPERPAPQEFIKMYAEGKERHAPALAISACPQESAWHREVLEGLVALPYSEGVTGRLALDWAAIPDQCFASRLVPWYESNLTRATEPKVAQHLALGYLSLVEVDEAHSLRALGTNPTLPEGVRAEILHVLHFRLDLQDQVDLYVETLGSGNMPPTYADYARVMMVGGSARDEFAKRVVETAIGMRDSEVAQKTLLNIIAELDYRDDSGGGLEVATVRHIRDRLQVAASEGRLSPEVARVVGAGRPIR